MTRWIIFALCLLVLVSALGWTTQRMLEMESAGRRAAVDAEFQERVRLALWRLDAATNPILIRENARPPHHYQAFHSGGDTFSSTFSPLAPGTVLTPSPLLTGRPPHVRLHFEQARSGVPLTSPQVPTGELRALALENYLQPAQLDEASRELQSLNPQASDLGLTASIICLPPPRLAGEGKKDRGEAPSAEQAQSISLPKQTYLPPPQSQQPASRKAQAEKSLKEAQVRSSLNDLNVDQAANLFLKKKQSALAGIAAAAAPASSPVGVAADGLMDRVDELAEEEKAALRIEASFPEVTAFSPVWNGGELFLLRQVIGAGVTRTQGLWLAWPSLQKDLENGVRDLLPDARLHPGKSGSDPDDPLHLMALPVRLAPGSAGPGPEQLGLLGSPLRRSLGLAWVSILAAAGAVGALLFGAIRLGERRGAFVSAVTHELRTPLTTFQLYTDLLSDGGADMAPEKRQKYVETLRGEAGRLSHLVENVLAYAQLERAPARRQSEKISLGNILERARDRLEHRANEAGMAVVFDMLSPVARREVDIDVSAVEQILFNLVDNACKYARNPPSGETENNLAEIQLSAVTDERGRPALRVADNGPGIRPAEAKRLFRPFEKSADQAAHSAPGVGLGLALCRRLARSLGGDLMLEPSTSESGGGASFLLALPG